MNTTALCYLCKSLSSLHEKHNLPSLGLPAGMSNATILLRCFDGIFFQGSEDQVLERRSTPAASPTARYVNPVTPLFAEWDIVDGELLRDEEKRLASKVDLVSVCDLKKYATTTMTLFQLKGSMQLALGNLKLQIEEERRVQLEQSVAVAVDNVLVLSKKEKEEQLHLLHKQIEDTRAAVASKRKILQEKVPQIGCQQKKVTEMRDRISTGLLGSCSLQARKAAKLRIDAVRSLGNFFCLDGNRNSINDRKVPTKDSIPENQEHALALGHICHLLLLFCAVHDYQLPHPVVLSIDRCQIAEREGLTEEMSLPLFSGKGTDRAQLRKGMELLRDNIVCAAFAVHGQKQAAGLPLVLALEKLVSNR